MKTLFIESRKKFIESEINYSQLNNLPGKTISLAATIQYLDLIPKVKTYLESINKKVVIKKGAKHHAHILGCNSTALDKTSDTILILADGKFHAMNNAIQLQRELYIFDTRTIDKISSSELTKHNQKIIAKQKKFLLSKQVGLIISSKHGQHYPKIQFLKAQIQALDKRVYILEANNINTLELENFPTIPIFINTACRGLARDSNKIINYQDIQKFLK